MKQINPFELHSEGLYRVCEFQAQSAREKMVLQTKLSRREPGTLLIGQRVWWNLFHFGKQARLSGQEKAV